jgi:hypothetical protein
MISYIHTKGGHHDIFRAVDSPSRPVLLNAPPTAIFNAAATAAMAATAGNGLFQVFLGAKLDDRGPAR